MPWTCRWSPIRAIRGASRWAPAVSSPLPNGKRSKMCRGTSDLIGSAKGLDFRRITISAAGAGERNVFVSYISEVPVWKSTYRVLLDGKTGGEALVQGWAIVDNTIGEDWNDVELSLISGAPES